MGEHSALQWLEQALGALLFLLILVDIFLIVLYARIGSGIVSNRLAHLLWRFFRLASKPFGRLRGIVLSFCGPIILIFLVIFWALTLTCGAALIIHPNLGSSVKSSGGETPTDFITALEAGGGSMAIVGASDFTPQTGGFRLLYLFNSLIGMSVVSLTLTYLMQVYNALQRRNALGLRTYLLTAETGDAAELVAGLGRDGKFGNGYSDLANWAGEMSRVKESHHFYPVLFYFRFKESYYSTSQMTLVAFDTVSIIKSALDDDEYSWLKNSTAVAQLRRGAMLLVTTLTGAFLPSGKPDDQNPTDEETLERWRERYFAALRKLREANIKTIADEEAGAETYISLRREWDRYITELAPTMAYRMDEIDPAGNRPESDETQ
ncbi:MAG TPA: hypothetical protein VF599_01655 [Pyrinomonadaceae bacterium]|jgi:hypothetical protein